jgi:D-alanyl-D-alanine carboxypeptidase (penicillin-binding protein 5/6)
MNLIAKLTSAILTCLTLVAHTAQAALPVPPAPQLNARAWLLMDTASGLPLAEKDADARVEPASLTKLMTAYLSFVAIKEGRLKLDQTLPVSDKAWRAEGSRMFLEPSKPAKVEDLLRGMIVQSGNDACIVLAEAIAGSEEGFVSMMNQMAKRLGLTGTRFQNSTGLPHPEHYTTARDLARLASALINAFPEHYKLYAEKDFTYNGIRQPNRNRLLYMDPSVDGMKTGHTESAGYCLIASGQRDRRRLLSVVLGTSSDAARAMESQKLLNYGFQAYDTVALYQSGKTVTTLPVWKGSAAEVKAGFLADRHVTLPKGQAAKLALSLVAQERLIAPIASGQRVGVVKVSFEERPVAEFPLIALEDVPQASFLGRAWDTVRLWFSK